MRLAPFRDECAARGLTLDKEVKEEGWNYCLVGSKMRCDDTPPWAYLAN